MSGLPPGEQVIKDTGMFPVTWSKGTFSNVNGKLILTNRRLIFTAGRFQDVISAIRGSHKDRAEIPLSSITSVDKGFMATIDIQAGGQKYTFKGMRGAGDWVQAINSTRMRSGDSNMGGGQQQNYNQPPPQPQQPGSRYCSNCGAPVVAGNNFCGKCGARVQ
ncbi:MAG: zinc-ribbon domain-containing protein [archaeon]